ncbi:hypothetical protein C8Q76DRAFT_762898 [Earliella scabrosa]|nr:hypothetical protein C8Q76DRAFT_762898 [Earliella scabrosa]
MRCKRTSRRHCIKLSAAARSRDSRCTPTRRSRQSITLLIFAHRTNDQHQRTSAREPTAAGPTVRAHGRPGTIYDAPPPPEHPRSLRAQRGSSAPRTEALLVHPGTPAASLQRRRGSPLLDNYRRVHRDTHHAAPSSASIEPPLRSHFPLCTLSAGLPRVPVGRRERGAHGTCGCARGRGDAWTRGWDGDSPHCARRTRSARSSQRGSSAAASGTRGWTACLPIADTAGSVFRTYCPSSSRAPWTSVVVR